MEAEMGECGKKKEKLKCGGKLENSERSEEN